ncbi:choice-of-anchor J domain-containing protein [Myroides indicus]|nr:choice-of-anchor J domain-containing protein [Myroides indicus]
MKIKLFYRILIVFFMIITLSFSKKLTYENIYLNEEGETVSINALDCNEPKEIKILNVLPNSADFSWEDEENTEWEYYVQDAWEVAPVGSGVLSKSKSVTVTRTSGLGGVNFQPGTEYDFYVRASCGGGKFSAWVGPLRFKTPCNAIALPFWEGFNSDSTTIDCWEIVDNNKDSTSSTDSNIWKITTTSYEGTHAMYFIGNQSDNSKRPHDDWLISPTFTLDATKVYRLKYYYRLDSNSLTSYEYEYEVLLSNSGISVDDFTTIVVPSKKYNPDTVWTEQTAFITGINGNINLAWHVTSSTQYTYIYIDAVSLEEIECPEPINLGSKYEEKSTSTIFWEDEFGSDWEYVVQESGKGAPAVSGTLTTNKEVIVTKDIKGKNLEENTEYELYVRTDCGAGKYSEWSGPYVFRTGCGVFGTPFWEGFNVGHDSKYCWTIIDSNGDSTSKTADIWHFDTTSYEGTHSARFNGTSSADVPHDDWLISPTIEFEKGKTYRLKYHYRTSSITTYEYEFEVLLSDSGVDEDSFKTTIIPKKNYEPESVWIEQTTFIEGVEGHINLAWHVTSNTQYTTIYIDNIFVEEVENCPEPYNLGVKDIETDSVTIYWTDDMGGSNYEYYIQGTGGSEPLGNGISTTQKEVVATKDGKGTVLNHNTNYELYVRTDCGDGTFSSWSGPVKFTTPCGVFETTFLENFNLDSPTMRCWTEDDLMVSKEIINTYKNVFFSYDNYEGDDSPLLTNFIDNFLFAQSRIESNLISPQLKLEGGTYMLKYNYISPVSVKAFGVPLNTMMELKLSGTDNTGKAIEENIVTRKLYSADSWEEEILFITGVSGEVNLQWRVTSDGTYYAMGIDNLSLKEVKTCPEPYFIELTNASSSSVTVQWEQFGDIKEWEVIIVNYGEDETASPIKTLNVTGTPQTTISGLDAGKAYTIYVRAKCKDNVSASEWSSSINAATEVSANNNCTGALNIPVNLGPDCEEFLSISTLGSFMSSSVLPACYSDDVEADVWLEFTANSTAHLLTFKNIKEQSEGSLPSFDIAVYGVNCSAISTSTPLFCDSVYPYSSTERMLTGLIPGQKYFVRIAFPKGNYLLTVCLTQSEWGYMEVSASGEKYSVDELIKDVLIQSNCNLVSNVRYQVGDGSPATASVNTLGYFKKGNTEFPFTDGIVLSTSEVDYVPGPYTPSGSFKGDNPHRWTGDKDINDAIKNAGGGPREDKRVTQVEFDFIPIKDSLDFEYLFVSNSYIEGCTYTCENGALFAAWLIDETTGEGVNLAKIKGTNTPISLYTIWDSNKIIGTSCSSYPELFWKNYSSGISHPLDAPFNFAGATKAMSSETVYVVPGRKYHIKLAVMDFCPTSSHSSAVFFNAGSFDLGTLDLGEDLLIETNTALCEDESVLIRSGVTISEELNTKIEWKKDGVIIPGATEVDLEVRESGVYTVQVDFVDINCQREDSITIEMYPPISESVNQAKDIIVCRQALEEVSVNLISVETEMFKDVERSDYNTEYYKTIEEAEASENAISNVENYALGKEPQAQTLYIRVESMITGCHEIFELHIQPEQGAIPDKPSDVLVCAEYVFPQVNGTQYYYMQPGGEGKAYKTGDVLAEPGEHTIYLLQINNEEGCYEEIAYKVKITAPVVADVFEDKTLSCEYYELKPLSEYNHYFTEPGGNGDELYPGRQILEKQTIYVYASSEGGLCTDESSFTIDYEDCPIPRGISPNNDGLNDVFDLTPHGVENIKIYNRWGTEVYSHGAGYTTQWHGQNKNGKQLPDGTYYYVIQAHGKTRTGWVQINK